MLLVASAMAAPVRVMPEPPSLPLFTYDVLPGEGLAPGTYGLNVPASIFSDWAPRRIVLIAELKAGTSVTLLTGACEVDSPDLITVTMPLPELQLNPGDTFLRCTYRGESKADFWAKGRWYTNADGAFITEADGSGCQSQCKAHETGRGRRKWWFRLRLVDGRIGWTYANESLDPNYFAH